jgi:hypothetical protein
VGGHGDQVGPAALGDVHDLVPRLAPRLERLRRDPAGDAPGDDGEVLRRQVHRAGLPGLGVVPGDHVGDGDLDQEEARPAALAEDDGVG